MCVCMCVWQFARAIEVKQVAQQEAERSKFVVMKSEQVSPLTRITCLTNDLL